MVKKDISSSREDYLEAVYRFETANQKARVVEIANALSVKKSSVTEALQNLAKEGFVNYVPYSPITLTEKGRITAEKIFRKHNILKSFFSDVFKLSEEEATETACCIEHVVSEDVATRFGALHSILKEKDLSSVLDKLHSKF